MKAQEKCYLADPNSTSPVHSTFNIDFGQGIGFMKDIKEA